MRAAIGDAELQLLAGRQAKCSPVPHLGSQPVVTPSDVPVPQLWLVPSDPKLQSRHAQHSPPFCKPIVFSPIAMAAALQVAKEFPWPPIG